MREETYRGRGRGTAPTPWLAFVIPFLALIAYEAPGLASLLELDRAAVRSGELWRLFTGHLAHYSLDHLLFDVLAFFSLGLACERAAPAKTRWTLVLAAVVIPGAVLLFLRDLERYRGLSGLDAALFALLVTRTLSKASWKTKAGTGVMVAGVLFVAKLAFEFTTNQAFFLDSAMSGFTPVPLAHLLGALCGVSVALFPADRSAQASAISRSRSLRSAAKRWIPSHRDSGSMWASRLSSSTLPPVRQRSSQSGLIA